MKNIQICNKNYLLWEGGDLDKVYGIRTLKKLNDEVIQKCLDERKAEEKLKH